MALLFSTTSSTQAQTDPPSIEWQRVLDPAGGPDIQITRAPNNGCALLYSGNVLRLSESGSTRWQTAIPPLPEFPTNTNRPVFITSIPDGGFAVLVRNTYRWSLARLDADGAVLWVKSFADYVDITSSMSRYFSGLIYTADGGFLVIGYTQFGRNGTSSNVYKFDGTGALTLQKSLNNDYGNNARGNTTINQVVQDKDGNYVVVGIATDINANFTPWAARLDQQLNFIWKKNYTGRALEDVILSPYADGSFIAIGDNSLSSTQTITIGPTGEMTDSFSQPLRFASTKSFLTAGPANHTIIDIVNERSGDIRLQRRLNQNQGWLKKLGGSSAEVIKGVVATSDGGYLIAGTTTSTDGDIEGKTTNELTGWVVKLKPNCPEEPYSVQAGNWNDPATWSCGQIPTGAQTVHIKHKVVLPLNYVANAYKIIYDLPVQLQWEDGARLLMGQ